MTTIHRGFAAITAIIIVFGLLALGGAGYVAFHPDIVKAPESNTATTTDDGVQTEPGDHQEVDHDANDGVSVSGKSSISWKLTNAGERNNIPYTKVAVIVNGTTHEMGEFQGSCAEVGASGGVDGKGLLAGELSAVQCWFAGGGDEIGVFAHEDGGFQVMVGALEEPIEGSAGFRGDFSIKVDIKP